MSRGAGAGAGRRALLCLAAAALWWAPPAHSHAVLVRSVPASRAALKEAPARVQLWFSERLEPAFSSLGVWSAAEAQVDLRDASVASDDPKRLSVTLAPLGPGSYTVRYRVLSVDGHIVDSRFSFTIRGGAPPR